MTKQDIIEKIIADGVAIKCTAYATQDGQIFGNSQVANNYWKKLNVPVKLPLIVVSEQEINDAKEPKASEVKETTTSKTKK